MRDVARAIAVLPLNHDQGARFSVQLMVMYDHGNGRSWGRCIWNLGLRYHRWALPSTDTNCPIEEKIE